MICALHNWWDTLETCPVCGTAAAVMEHEPCADTSAGSPTAQARGDAPGDNQTERKPRAQARGRRRARPPTVRVPPESGHGIDAGINGAPHTPSANPVTPHTDGGLPSGGIDTGILAAVAGKQEQAGSPNTDVAGAEHAASPAQDAMDADVVLDFLDDFFGGDKRHLVAIKKRPNRSPIIRAGHFEAADRVGQEKFITEFGSAGFDLYFSPNPIKMTLHKKAKKDDVAEARHLWIDLDPRPGEPLEAERTTMLTLLTTDLPPGMPRPNRVIDSGRGFWGYWKLAAPQPVDGNGPLTEAVESYGRRIEAAFGDRFADGCRNIDRVARLPGTINRKTGRLACVLREHSHDQPHQIETFPPKVDEQEAARGTTFTGSGSYEPIEPGDPALANLGYKWRDMLTDLDYAAPYGGDRSRAEIAFVAAAIRSGVDDHTIARCLMDGRRAFGGNTRVSERLLARIMERAHQYADNPVLEQMNRDYAAGFIGNKFRIAKFDRYPRYPLQRKIEFLSKEDFVNGVINPRASVPKFNSKGERDGEKMEPRGSYWLDLPGRGEFDAVTFQPGASPVIEVERDGRIHRTLNTYCGFTVVADHIDSATKCAKYLAHIHDNIAGEDERLYVYILDWMASGVQHPDNPGRSSLSLRGAPGCGKGVFALGYGRLFGQHFLHATHRDHVVGKFNAHQAETCQIFVDEAL